MITKYSDSSLLLKPGAFIPLLMSLIALSMVLVHAAVVGVVHEADEGTLAHIFQILMIVQIPFALFFILNWIDKKPKQTLQILAAQVAAWLAAIAAVLFLT